jgi:nifR3 family TIM-barrel protein
VKLRMGIDADTLTYLEAGQAAEHAGAAAVALHARTAAQLYSGTADWSAIARLKAHLDVPVLGNGDIWTADDALAMVAATGADGVVVGRGCLGRPWLFRDLADAFEGRPVRAAPRLGEVVDTLVEHAELLVARRDEPAALAELRKHTGWYLTGYPVGGEVRAALSRVSTLAELREVLAGLDPDLTAPDDLVAAPRGTRSGPQTVTLPSGWEDRSDELAPLPLAAGAAVQGG